MGVIYSGLTYFYRKSAQNDVISRLDKDGNVVVKYTYGACGNNTVTVLDASATTIANLNPFRYRSYYYDTETNLYFLKTRYYDPEVCRFMTIDSVRYLNSKSINGLNLYAYCLNNPVMHVDSTGRSTFSINLSAFLGWLFVDGYSFSIGLSGDSEDMLAFQATYSVPNDDETKNNVYGATASAGVTMQFTNLDSVSDLEGEFVSYGINGPISVDVLFDSSGNYVGIAIGVGVGVSFDFHINKTQTLTIGSEFRSLIKIFKDWVGI